MTSSESAASVAPSDVSEAIIYLQRRIDTGKQTSHATQVKPRVAPYAPNTRGRSVSGGMIHADEQSRRRGLGDVAHSIATTTHPAPMNGIYGLSNTRSVRLAGTTSPAYHSHYNHNDHNNCLDSTNNTLSYSIRNKSNNNNVNCSTNANGRSMSDNDGVLDWRRRVNFPVAPHDRGRHASARYRATDNSSDAAYSNYFTKDDAQAQYPPSIGAHRAELRPRRRSLEGSPESRSGSARSSWRVPMRSNETAGHFHVGNSTASGPPPRASAAPPPFPTSLSSSLSPSCMPSPSRQESLLRRIRRPVIPHIRLASDTQATRAGCSTRRADAATTPYAHAHSRSSSPAPSQQANRASTSNVSESITPSVPFLLRDAPSQGCAQARPASSPHVSRPLPSPSPSPRCRRHHCARDAEEYAKEASTPPPAPAQERFDERGVGRTKTTRPHQSAGTQPHAQQVDRDASLPSTSSASSSPLPPSVQSGAPPRARRNSSVSAISRSSVVRQCAVAAEQAMGALADSLARAQTPVRPSRHTHCALVAALVRYLVHYYQRPCATRLSGSAGDADSEASVGEERNGRDACGRASPLDTRDMHDLLRCLYVDIVHESQQQVLPPPPSRCDDEIHRAHRDSVMLCHVHRSKNTHTDDADSGRTYAIDNSRGDRTSKDRTGNDSHDWTSRYVDAKTTREHERSTNDGRGRLPDDYWAHPTSSPVRRRAASTKAEETANAVSPSTEDHMCRDSTPRHPRQPHQQASDPVQRIEAKLPVLVRPMSHGPTSTIRYTAATPTTAVTFPGQEATTPTRPVRAADGTLIRPPTAFYTQRDVSRSNEDGQPQHPQYHPCTDFASPPRDHMEEKDAVHGVKTHSRKGYAADYAQGSDGREDAHPCTRNRQTALTPTRRPVLAVFTPTASISAAAAATAAGSPRLSPEQQRRALQSMPCCPYSGELSNNNNNNSVNNKSIKNNNFHDNGDNSNGNDRSAYVNVARDAKRVNQSIEVTRQIATRAQGDDGVSSATDATAPAAMHSHHAYQDYRKEDNTATHCRSRHSCSPDRTRHTPHHLANPSSSAPQSHGNSAAKTATLNNDNRASTSDAAWSRPTSPSAHDANEYAPRAHGETEEGGPCHSKHVRDSRSNGVGCPRRASLYAASSVSLPQPPLNHPPRQRSLRELMAVLRQGTMLLKHSAHNRPPNPLFFRVLDKATEFQGRRVLMPHLTWTAYHNTESSISSGSNNIRKSNNDSEMHIDNALNLIELRELHIGPGQDDGEVGHLLFFKRHGHVVDEHELHIPRHMCAVLRFASRDVAVSFLSEHDRQLWMTALREVVQRNHQLKL